MITLFRPRDGCKYSYDWEAVATADRSSVLGWCEEARMFLHLVNKFLKTCGTFYNPSCRDDLTIHRGYVLKLNNNLIKVVAFTWIRNLQGFYKPSITFAVCLFIEFAGFTVITGSLGLTPCVLLVNVAVSTCLLASKLMVHLSDGGLIGFWRKWLGCISLAEVEVEGDWARWFSERLQNATTTP